MKDHITTNTDLIFSFFGNFYWFSGVIENISDPEASGRVQVRCIGYHPDNKSLVPTEDLPWAHVMLPTTSAGVSGIGSTHGLIEGSWVVGFFSDGRDAQQPIVMGTIAGNPKPSRNQENLIESGQSIGVGSGDGVGGLIQSTKLEGVSSVVNSSLGPSISDANNSIDLSSYKDILDSGINPFDLNNSTVQSNNILSVIGTSNDIRSSQIYNSIQNNQKIKTSLDEGKNILSYISKYSNENNNIFDQSRNLKSLNSKNGLVDVNTNYEKALDNSVENAGLISIEHNGIRKSQSSAPISKFKNLDQYHFVITSQGQVFPKQQLSKSINKNDGLEKIISRGNYSNNIRICLIGGLPDNKKYDSTASFNERFSRVQMNAAIRLIRTLLKKYPKAIIDGANNLVKDGSSSIPGFNVMEAFKEVFPENVNKTASGSPKILGTDSSNNITNEEKSYVDNKAFQDPRGIYPSVNYGQDYPVVGRVNAITNKKRSPNIIESIKGNLTKFSVQEPRNAVDRTAIGVIDPTQIPVSDWGGEYGMTHVIRETLGGHAIYADDTPGKERMLFHAASGAVIDMKPDGSIVIMAQGDQYELTQGTLSKVVNGDSVTTINGSKKEKIAGDYILEVGGRFAIVSKETNEFISGNKTVLAEGIFKQQSKAGHYIEVGRDYSLDVGGDKQSITAGTVVDQAGVSRLTATTGSQTTKSNNSVDITLGNRMMMTRGNQTLSSNGKSSIFSQGDSSISTAGNLSTNATGNMTNHAGGSNEVTSGGKMSLNGTGGIGIDAGGANISLDGGNIKMLEGTLADKTDAANIQTFEYPEKLQPVSSVSNPEANPSAVDFSFGQRHEMEGHDEIGGGSNAGSRSAFNAGTDSNTNSPANPSNGAKTNLDPISLGGSAGTGCEVANKLKTRGMTEEAASAYAGAFMQESGFRPTVTNRIGATGIAQWTSSGQRKEQMIKFTNGSNTIDSQLDFVMHELKTNPNGNAGAAATTWKTDNLDDAIKSAAYYERFKGFESARNGVYHGEEWGDRTGYAASIYKDCFNKDPGRFNPVSNFDTGVGLNESGTNTNGPTTGVGTGPDSRGSEKDVNLPPIATKYLDRNQKISEFFTLDDMLQSGGNKFDLPAYVDTPNGRISADELVQNMSSLAVNVLDVLTRKLGKVTINSGFRHPRYNNKVGGKRNSQHMYGRAADITVAGYSPSQVHEYVRNNIPAATGLGRYRTFTHVDNRPGGRATW